METLVPISDDWRSPEVVVTPFERADRPAVAALATILAVDLAIFAYVAIGGFVRQPFSDMFAFLGAEFDFERGGDLLAYLASTHNGQHLIWVRILTALDVQVFNGAGAIFLAASSLSILVAALAPAVELWRGVPIRVVGAISALLAAMLMISALNALDCTQPINCVYAIAAGFAVLAVVLFEHAASEQGGRAVLFAALALAAGLSAAAGSAAGVAAFPALIVSALRHPSHRGLTAATLVVGPAAMAIIVTGLLGAEASQAQVGANHIGKMAAYFVIYAGMPWSSVRLLSRLRLVVGLVAIVVGAALVWRGARRQGAAGRLERIGLDLIVFALVTAAMAAIGRVDQSDAVSLPARYAVFMSVFQVGVICVLAPEIAERWSGMKRFAVPASLALALMLLAHQVAAGKSVLQTSQTIRREIAAFEAGARRPDMRQLIFPDFNVAMRIEAECRRRGLYQ